MGLIQCEKHGFQGIVFVCFHVSESLNSLSKPNELITSKMILDNFLDDEIFFKCIYCLVCSEKYSLPKENGILSEESVEDIGLIPVCGKCFTEFEQNKTRKITA